ncbi:MAG: sensor histidine kinase [Saccharospirillum sp.]
MIKPSQLATLIVLSVLLWLASLTVIVLIGWDALEPWQLGAIGAAVLVAGLVGFATLNLSQSRADQAYREMSRVKRSLQESHLKIERYEYESKQGAELRRLVLTSNQEKDQMLKNLASALNKAMAEVIQLSESGSASARTQIAHQAEQMQRYADDLKALARLELKSELPRHEELDFLKMVDGFVEEWNQLGKASGVKVRVDHQEDQLPIVSDPNWIHNVLTRIVMALIRMNRNTQVGIHLIGYIDADRGEALRATFTVPGRVLNGEQLGNLLVGYTNVTDEHNNDVGPGLSLVVARRLAQLLRGSLEVNPTVDGTEAVLVLPRRLAPQQPADFVD